MAAPGAVSPEKQIRQALRAAVSAARYAPSVLNTQPWRWRLTKTTLELYLDDERILRRLDPHGRLATLSCGAALHHARVELAAAGYEPATHRLPDDSGTGLLALVSVTPAETINRRDVAMARAITLRHTDRRPIAGDRPMGDDHLNALMSAASREGVSLHRVEPTQRPFLATAVNRGQTIETADESYRRELHGWTLNRPVGSGISVTNMVAPVPRPVALRDFTDGGETGLYPGFGDDTFVEYLVVVTTRDTPIDWLRAGEATSAVWLTAAGNGLAMSALSDVVEVAGARALLASLLAGPGHPQLVLRAGLQGQPTPPPYSSRRELRDVLDEDPPIDD